MNQLSMDFSVPARRVETPAFRRTDPVTSELAAEHITKTGLRAAQQALTIAAVCAFPGMTMQELAALTTMDRYMLGRRISECETAGKVRRMPKRKCDITGRMAEPWSPI